ncbi:hypothetical protein [Pseudoscardovia suis]|uniref:hypothetical protein n=1 Tax=Pseudoscardovia suis TaxID=987063 RepID=UPI0012FE8CFB|nr:hypothetical protein [Pseudoscardovia suis]
METFKAVCGFGLALVKFTGIGLHNEKGFLLGAWHLWEIFIGDLLKISVEESGSNDD